MSSPSRAISSLMVAASNPWQARMTGNHDQRDSGVAALIDRRENVLRQHAAPGQGLVQIERHRLHKTRHL
jgi:hypothetical protein